MATETQNKFFSALTGAFLILYFVLNNSVIIVCVLSYLVRAVVDNILYSRKCPCHPEPLPIGNYRDEEVEVVEGGMGDYNYMHHGCLEFTIEVH